MPKTYTVSDGKLILHLTEGELGYLVVTSPTDPAVNTQAKSVPEAFRMARDAIKALKGSRARLAREVRGGKYLKKKAS